jgi:hypothetical protein
MKNIIFIVIVVGILAAIVFAIFWSMQYTPSHPEASPSQAVPQAVQQPSLPSVLYNLQGTVKSVGANSLVIDAKIPEITQDGEYIHTLQEKTVLITPQTKVSRLSIVVDEAGKKQVKETAITFGTLRQGNSIEVITNKEIRTMIEIPATQIRLLPGG